MAKVKPVEVNDLQGGLDLSDPTIIPDNALALATNAFYNSDKLLQTRYGQANWGQPIPAVALTIHNCDTTGGNGTWAASDDANTLTASASVRKRGAGALLFNITVASSVNNYATLANSTLSGVDITTTKGYVGFFIFVPTGGKTNLTNCILRMGSDSSNYYEFTVLPAQLTENQWNYIPSLFSNATTTGTPVDTAIDYLMFRVNYSGSYLDQTGWGLDDIVCYSSTSNLAAYSLKYFESSDYSKNFPRYLMAQVGTCWYEWDETTGYWNIFKTGVTAGARASMAAYKNIMYFTNGVDNYFDYTGIVATDRTGANTYKGKYLIVANDVGYILGDPTVPSTLGYTNATPSNLQTFPNALVLDEDSSDGKGTALANLGPIVIAGKDRKIYQVNIATPSREQLDYSDGIESHRAFVRVENELFIFNSNGISTIAQRQATVGSLRTDPISEQLQPLIDIIKNKSISAGIYIERFSNFYISVDTNDDDIPDTLIIFSTLTKKWSTYTGFNINEFVWYKDADGDYHLLYADATTGQIREMETGTNDFGTAIVATINSKVYHFDQPATLKTFEYVDLVGFITQNGLAEAYIVIDDTYTTPVAYIDGTNYYTGSGGASYTLGTSPLGTTSLGGSVSSTGGIQLYPFKLRIPIEYTGSKIQIKFVVNTVDTIFIPQKFTIYPIGQTIELFESSLIA